LVKNLELPPFLFPHSMDIEGTRDYVSPPLSSYLSFSHL
jgi:hypothetical protein